MSGADPPVDLRTTTDATRSYFLKPRVGFTVVVVVAAVLAEAAGARHRVGGDDDLVVDDLDGRCEIGHDRIERNVVHGDDLSRFTARTCRR